MCACTVFSATTTLTLTFPLNGARSDVKTASFCTCGRQSLPTKLLLTTKEGLVRCGLPRCSKCKSENRSERHDGYCCEADTPAARSPSTTRTAHLLPPLAALCGIVPTRTIPRQRRNVKRPSHDPEQGVHDHEGHFIFRQCGNRIFSPTSYLGRLATLESAQCSCLTGMSINFAYK